LFRREGWTTGELAALTEPEYWHWITRYRLARLQDELNEHSKEILRRSYWDKKDADKASAQLRELERRKQALCAWYYGDERIKEDGTSPRENQDND